MMCLRVVIRIEGRRGGLSGLACEHFDRMDRYNDCCYYCFLYRGKCGSSDFGKAARDLKPQLYLSLGDCD
jgi:hypothetical protein